jgi:hemolysin type calcium-binding protein
MVRGWSSAHVAVTLALALAVMATGAWPAAAGEASVDSARLLYRAAPGEDNRLRLAVEIDGERVVFLVEDGAAVSAGPNCVPTANPAAVRCTRSSSGGFVVPAARVFLGDGNDVAVVSEELRDKPCICRFSGGPGNDRLTAAGVLAGGDGDDLLVGGSGFDSFKEGGTRPNGSDVILGGGGGDTVSYVGRRGPVRADLEGDRDDGQAGERDRIGADVERLFGGKRDDRLAGNGGSNGIFGKGGADRIQAGRGSDYINGGSGADRIDAGPGIDEVVGGPGADRIDPGPGADEISADEGRDFIDGRDRSRDEVSCGEGRDTALIDGLDKVPDRDCEHLGRRGAGRAVSVKRHRLEDGEEHYLDRVHALALGAASASLKQYRSQAVARATRRSGAASVRPVLGGLPHLPQLRPPLGDMPVHVRVGHVELLGDLLVAVAGRVESEDAPASPAQPG